MEFTINLIWVILGAVSVIISIIVLIGGMIKTNKASSREAERFESWLKTHEKEIQNLQIEHKAIREAQAIQNSSFMSEIRKVEHLISELSKSNAIIQNTLEIILKSGNITKNSP
jgi:hypothetical protein